MKETKDRMTYGELKELLKGGPVTLKSDKYPFNPYFKELVVTAINETNILCSNKIGGKVTYSGYGLRCLDYYPTLKEPNKVFERAFECVTKSGHTRLYFRDGSSPHFIEKKKDVSSTIQGKEALDRKTGNFYDINMKTFEIKGKWDERN